MAAAKSTPQRSPRTAGGSVGWLVETLVECAVSAFVLAILVQIVGGIVLGVVGGLWHDMIPSLPPGLGKPSLESTSGWTLDFSFIREHRLAILFWGIFLIKVAGELVHASGRKAPRRAAAWLTQAYRQVSGQWFTLVVVNAFIALVGAWLTQLAQQFSLTAWLWYLAALCLKPLIAAMAGVLHAAGPFQTASDLASWLNANQFRFTFWLLYWGAIADDLGLPNFKALGRWLWRRWRRPGVPAAAVVEG